MKGWRLFSYSGSPTKIAPTTAGFGTLSGSKKRLTTFEEAPWVYKCSGIYYLIYAADCCSEDIFYMWDYFPAVFIF
jgi:hypothetical protein